MSGLGLGPRGRITSAVAPLSEVNGYARYNWGEEDWSWGAGARRDLFGGRLGIGGDYRWDYESGMDWAVPETESNLNELLLGYESKNYYHVESSGGYVVYSLNDRIEARADFFDNRYRSVEKVTNWSLFNRGDTKEPNAPLGADQPGRISGLRYSLDLHDQTSSQNFRSRFEVERSFKNGSGTGPLYTRLFVTAAWNMQYWYGDLVKFRLAGGYSPHTLPDQRSFRLGGLNTLRGYAPMSVPVHPAGETPFTIYDGGDRMFLANLDYFYGRDIALIFFGDLGGVWRKGETVDAAGLRRDIGIGLALGGDFFTAGNESDDNAGFRVNWAMPVGPVPHVSRWTVNFVRAY